MAACLVPVFRLHWITSLVPNGNAKVDEARRWLHEAAETIVPCYTGSPATPEEQVPAPSQPSTSTNAFHRLFGYVTSFLYIPNIIIIMIIFMMSPDSALSTDTIPLVLSCHSFLFKIRPEPCGTCSQKVHSE